MLIFLEQAGAEDNGTGFCQFLTCDQNFSMSVLLSLIKGQTELGQTQFKIGLDHTLIFCSLNIFFAHGLFLLKIPKKYFFSY